MVVNITSSSTATAPANKIKDKVIGWSHPAELQGGTLQVSHFFL